MPHDIWLNPVSPKFSDIQQEASTWFENREKGRGTGYKQWKRWEAFNSSRLTENGEVTDPRVRAYKSYKAIKEQQGTKNSRSVNGHWTAWGATDVKRDGGWIPGIGRVNTIEFHPSIASTLYVGTPSGGLWRTTNHGGTWTCLTNELGSLGVSGIAIHPSNSNIIYVLTGDGDSGNTRSIGVYKSTNGGSTWNETGLSWDLTDNIRGYKLMMEPGNPTHLLVAATNGMWQTKNSGTTWTNVEPRSFRDIEYKPGTSSIVYASTTSGIYKSINSGTDWTFIQSVLSANRIQLAVSPNNTSTVYAIAGGVPSAGNFNGFYKSSDSGESFSLRSSSPNILGGGIGGTGNNQQSWYDLAVVVHPSNDNKVIMGGVNTWESLNGGQTWTQKTHWDKRFVDTSSLPLVYMHADIHFLKYNPSNNVLYCANDGGIYVSFDDGTNWQDLTGGMNISQLYHFDGTQQDLDFMVGGLQDNGTCIFTGADSMINVIGADGVDCVINPLNKKTLYAGWQNGIMQRSSDGGKTFIGITPPAGQNGPFITDFDINPVDTNILLLGWTNRQVYRSTNRGTNWTLINVENSGGNNDNILDVTFHPNGTTAYAIHRSFAYRSLDAGLTWSRIFTNTDGSNLTSIEPFFNASNECLITRGGFDDGAKVYHVDASNNVTELNGIFPAGVDAVPVNIIKSDPVGPNVLYIGTDIGVFVTNILNFFDGNPANDTWTLFHDLLPNVIVNDLHIYPGQELIRAATFGRGIWESSTRTDCAHLLTLTPQNDPSNGSPGLQVEKADKTITSTRVIGGSNGDVKYGARDLILLKNGFRANSGNKVIVKLEDCIGNPTILN